MNENVRNFHDYLISLIDPNQYNERRSAMLSYLERVLQEGRVEVSELRSKFVPIDNKNDLPMYYLLQIELFLQEYAERDVAFISRLFPKFQTIGYCLPALRVAKNFEQKCKKLLRKNNQSVENDLFELCVAALYSRNGFNDIEFIRETKDKTPDLRANDVFVECKRKAKECDYSIAERQFWYRLQDPVCEFLRRENMSLVYEVRFKHELGDYPEQYLLKKVKKTLSHRKDLAFDDDNISLKMWPVNLLGYEAIRHDRPIRIDSPTFHRVLYGYDMIGGGITSVLGHEYDKAVYKVSPRIYYANAGIWYSESPVAREKKVVSLRKNFEKALAQIPDSNTATIHIGYESYEGSEVEQEIIRRALNDLNSLSVGQKKLRTVFIHILRFEMSDEVDSVFEETVAEFKGPQGSLLLEPRAFVKLV